MYSLRIFLKPMHIGHQRELIRSRYRAAECHKNVGYVYLFQKHSHAFIIDT